MAQAAPLFSVSAMPHQNRPYKKSNKNFFQPQHINLQPSHTRTCHQVSSILHPAAFATRSATCETANKPPHFSSAWPAFGPCQTRVYSAESPPLQQPSRIFLAYLRPTIHVHLLLSTRHLTWQWTLPVHPLAPTLGSTVSSHGNVHCPHSLSLHLPSTTTEGARHLGSRHLRAGFYQPSRTLSSSGPPTPTPRMLPYDTGSQSGRGGVPGRLVSLEYHRHLARQQGTS